MDTTKFVEGLDRLYASWRNYGNRVSNAKRGLPDSFDLDVLVKTERWLYTRMHERIECSRDLGIDLPQDRKWSWLAESVLSLSSWNVE